MRLLAKCITCDMIIKNILVTDEQSILLGKGIKINLIHPSHNNEGDVVIRPPVAVDLNKVRIMRLSITPECVYFEGCAGGKDCMSIPDRFLACAIKEPA